jgi:hypothetical protein
MRLASNVVPADRGNAFVGLQQRGQDPNCRRLACPVRTEQAQHTSRANRQVDTGKSGRFAKALDQTLGGNRVLRRSRDATGLVIHECPQHVVSLVAATMPDGSDNPGGPD